MYLIRLDDATENWDKKNWHRMHDILQKYNIKPVVAIIPHNEDGKFLAYPVDPTYTETILKWIKEGWTPALHGYNHILRKGYEGINPINNRSEFSGLPLDEQEERISKGNSILQSMGIDAKIFVAPAHTFDKNTLKALKNKTDIRIISDTIANDIYYKDEFFYIPQQSGHVMNVNFKLTTFCYHPNIIKDKDFELLENFLEKHSNEFVAFDNIQMKKRSLSIYDHLLAKVYFLRHKILNLISKSN